MGGERVRHAAQEAAREAVAAPLAHDGKAGVGGFADEDLGGVPLDDVGAHRHAGAVRLRDEVVQRLLRVVPHRGAEDVLGAGAGLGVADGDLEGGHQPQSAVVALREGQGDVEGPRAVLRFVDAHQDGRLLIILVRLLLRCRVTCRIGHGPTVPGRPGSL